MSDETIGYNISVTMAGDTEIEMRISMTTNAPKDATPEQLAEKLAVMRRAGWMERIAAQERLQYRAHHLKEYRAQQLEERRKQGQHFDAKELAKEEGYIHNAILKVDSDLHADRATYQDNGAAR